VLPVQCIEEKVQGFLSSKGIQLVIMPYGNHGNRDTLFELDNVTLKREVQAKKLTQPEMKLLMICNESAD
jgi:hypothetical protein